METIEIAKSSGIFVRCNSGGVFDCAPEWDWRVNYMCDYDIWLVIGGLGRLESMGKVWELSAGDCFFLSPGTKLYAVHNPKYPLNVVSSHLDFLDSQGNKAAPIDAPPFHTRLTELLFMEKLMRKCVTNFLTGRRHQADMWLQAAVLELASRQVPRDSAESRYASEINEICCMIAAKPHIQYRIGELASRLHLCPDHFSRVFRKAMRLSPADFIINCRMEHAKNLLLSSNYPVSLIADMCGYKSVYYFSKHFKARQGKSPTQYRIAAHNPDAMAAGPAN